MRPVPAGLQPPELAAFLAEVRSAISQIQTPGQPVKDFAAASTQLPPAESYPNCRVLVTDKNAIAISTLVGTAWTWLRADGGAL